MSTITINDSVEDLLRELSFRDSREAIKEPLATEILARITAFQNEVKHFSEKYNKSFEALKKEYESGSEDFQVYDDLMAWEFAEQGLEYWQKKLEELNRVL